MAAKAATPLAIVGFDGEATASDAGLYFLAIRKYDCAEEPAWIQLIAWIGGPLQHRSPVFHMSSPAESRNPGMLAVGATHYWDTDSIASYSSRGPTLDGRIKPDITGVACGRSTVRAGRYSQGRDAVLVPRNQPGRAPRGGSDRAGGRRDFPATRRSS